MLHTTPLEENVCIASGLVIPGGQVRVIVRVAETDAGRALGWARDNRRVGEWVYVCVCLCVRVSARVSEGVFCTY